MDSKMVLQSNYLDLIFDGRNKQYGSYDLRITYPQRMRKAGVFIFTIALALASYSVWSNGTKTLPLMPSINKVDTTLFINPDLDVPKKVIVPPAPPLSKPSINTLKITPPDIVIDNAVKPDDKMATQDDLKKAVSGKLTLAGNNLGDESFDGKDGKSDGGGRETEGGGEGKKFQPEIPTFVEQMPEFPGGEQKLLEYLSANIQYPQQAVNGGQQGKVQVKFVVNEDGSISNVTTTRGFGFGSENESIRVVNGMPKWKPGRNNGKAVKVWFQLPVIFKLN